MAWLIRKGQSDSYSLHLGYKAVSASRALPQYSRHSVGEDGQHYDTVSLTWTDEDKESAVLERLAGSRLPCRRHRASEPSMKRLNTLCESPCHRAPVLITAPDGDALMAGVHVRHLM